MLEHQLSQKLTQKQKLLTSARMQQAFKILQAPIEELKELIAEELQSNPLLELEYSLPQQEEKDSSQEDNEDLKELDFCQDQGNFEDLDYGDYYWQEHDLNLQKPEDLQEKYNFQQSLITNRFDQQKSIKEQFFDLFSDPEEQKFAHILMGFCNRDGLLEHSLEDISSLEGVCIEFTKKVHQKFIELEPCGFGAIDLKQALLWQLEKKGLKNSWAFTIIEQHWDDLLHNRLPKLAKKLEIDLQLLSRIVEEDIRSLQLKPLNGMGQASYHDTIIPDLIIEDRAGKLVCKLSQDELPELCINQEQIKLLQKEKNEEYKHYLQKKLGSCRWLLKTLSQRGQTLIKLGEIFVQIQGKYFSDAQVPLVPMTMRELAELAQVHESTVARCVANKWISCPRGMLAMRDLFSYNYGGEEELSSNSIKEKIKELISQEDAKKPLSDQKISEILCTLNMACARRTVTKYRESMMLPKASIRRQH